MRGYRATDVTTEHQNLQSAKSPTRYQHGVANKVATTMVSPEMLCVWWQSALCCGSASLGPELEFAGAPWVDWQLQARQVNSLPRPGQKKAKL